MTEAYTRPERDPALLGAVLAGGASRRFGSPKALARFRGEPMVLRAYRVLAEVAGEVVVVGSAPGVEATFEREGHGARVVPDRLPGAGPLAGLHAALQHASDAGFEGVLVLACDMPLVEADLPALVAREGTGSGRPAAVPVGPDAQDEPLCAWYSVACLPIVERRLLDEDRSMSGLLAELTPHRVDPSGTPAGRAHGRDLLASANTPEELDRLEALAPTEEGTAPPAGLPAAVLVVGFKDSGKTGVAVRLVAELRTRGLRVGALKHGHGFRLDTPGTDSWRLTHEGGADPVVLAGPEGFAVLGGWGTAGEPPVRELLARHFASADVVVVEGYKGEPFPRIEVHRTASGDRLLCMDPASAGGPFLALVTDDPEQLGAKPPVPVFRRDDPALPRVLADLVTDRVLGRRTAGSRRS